ncbi:hypothetical protein SDC9_76382 [bioreactor metagenome]|uniref:Uncharacterized protein n=1 Tax=bioreactor metagenome TaxID=1076179 RepID=A0A644YPQ1_9ZZZZ
MGQHRHDAVRQIDAGAAFIGFAIDRGILRHVIGNIRDMHAQKIIAIFEPFQGNRIIQVFGIGAVDRDDLFRAQIPSAFQRLSRNLQRNAFSLGKHIFRKFGRDAEFIKDGQDINAWCVLVADFFCYQTFHFDRILRCRIAGDFNQTDTALHRMKAFWLDVDNNAVDFSILWDDKPQKPSFFTTVRIVRNKFTDDLIRLARQNSSYLGFDTSVIPRLGLTGDFNFDRVPFHRAAGFAARDEEITLIRIDGHKAETTIVASESACHCGTLRFKTELSGFVQHQNPSFFQLSKDFY